MFACFGLKAKHKRLSEVELVPDKLTESTKGRLTDSDHCYLTDSPLLKITDSPHYHNSLSVPRSTPHGTPLPKRASFRRRKNKRNCEAYVNNLEYPVKAARPTTTTSTTTTTTTTTLRNNVNRGPVHPASTPTLADQLRRVEEELEERGGEVRRERDLKLEVERRVEALTVLLHHINSTYDPFGTPRLRGEIHQLNCQLTETRLTLDETTAALRRLQETERETETRHRQEIESLKETQKVSLDKLLAEHRQDLNLAQEKHRKELSQFAEDQQTQRETVSRAHIAEVEQLEGEWRAKIDLQHEKHLCALQELNTKHINQIREIETSRKARERDLEEANYRLRQEQDSLKTQNKKLEETLLNDTDHRLAAVRSRCASLKSEVDSLKSVVDMKNTEIHTLRSQVVEVDRLTQDLELSRDRTRALQAKTEDLQAQMEKKALQERSLVNEHRQLVETYQRESNVNKRLSLENEELAWKLKEREELIMTISAPAPSTHSSLDMLSSTHSLAPHRPATPQTTPHRVVSRACGTVSPSKSEPGRRHRHKGSSIVGVEIEPTLSSSNKIQVVSSLSSSGVDVVSSTDIPDSPPPSPYVKAVVEKSNSVSFILDLTEGRPMDRHMDDFPLSPRRRPHRTASLSAADRPRPTLSSSFQLRRAPQKARAHTLARATHHMNGRNSSSSGCSSGSSGINGSSSSSSSAKSEVNRTTSEGSETGSDMSRFSPTGLSWTVPVRGPSCCPTSTPSRPQLLQDPQEDEYECAPQPTTRFLEGGVGLSSSENASDSELSQCSLKNGSSLGSTSGSESESEIGDGGEDLGENRPQNPNTRYPKTGAGEAMIPNELFKQYTEALDSPATAKRPAPTTHRPPSTTSDDSDDNTTPHNDHTDDEEGEGGGVGAGDPSWSEDVDVTSSSEIQDDL